MPERFDEQFSTFVNTALREYEQERGIQVRYLPKIHPLTSENTIENTISRLEEATRKAELIQAAPSLLVNQFNRPLSLPKRKRVERVEQILDFVRREFNQYREGQVNKLSTYRALCERFGYKNPGSVRLLLIRHGLKRERMPKPEPQMAAIVAQPESSRPKHRVRRDAKEIKDILTPSDQMAWMLGVLSAGGYTKPGVNTLSLRTGEPTFASAFRIIGEELFGFNAHTDTTPEKSTIIFFSSRTLTAALGDLRSGNWPVTIMEKYSWITNNEQYIWRFLEGYLDKSGEVRNAKVSKRMGFFAQYENAGNFLVEMLVKVGIERPLLLHKGSGRLAEVFVSNIRDVQRIANNVHLRSPSKEKELEELRSFSPHFERPANATADDLIEEWKRLRRGLEHTPTSYEIQELKRQKETGYHYKSYADRFGGGSFVKASEALERIISET